MIEVNTHYGLQTNCRICNENNLKSVINLGSSPHANSLLSKEELSSKEEMYPLEMKYCPNCHLCQLSYVLSPEKMFKHYLYVTSTTQTSRKHFLEMADKITNDFNLSNNSLVVDIGSNDGLILERFKERGSKVVGVEPAENLALLANQKGIETIGDFFNNKSVEQIIQKYGKADIVTANNVFAHVHNIKDLVTNVKILLKEEGVFVVEFQYLLDTIETTTFDNIYHEHLSYFSMTSLNEFFKRNDMIIFRMEHYANQGGAGRVYVQKKKGRFPIDPSVNEFLNNEKKFGLDNFETYKLFADKILAKKEKILSLLKEIKNEGKSIVGYGAPAKATTLLNFYNIDGRYLDYIIEDNLFKQNKYVPGVRVPIRSKAALDVKLPDYVFILAWNFTEEILRNNKHLINRGVKFILSSPTISIVETK